VITDEAGGAGDEDRSGHNRHSVTPAGV
jgi:hypothetical protein